MRKVLYHQIWIQNYLGFIVSDLTYILTHYQRHLLTFPNLNCRFITSKLHFSIHFFCWDSKTRFMHTKKMKLRTAIFLPLTTAHCACTNKALGVNSVVKFLWWWALQRKRLINQHGTLVETIPKDLDDSWNWW